MTQKNIDVIVIGVGTMGAPACYYLAKKGVNVLGLEQFSIPHDQGSHAGQSRIIRKAYFEHPDYVPLLERAYINWKTFEDSINSQLYYPTGLLYAGRGNDTLIKGVRESATKYGIELQELTHAEAKVRFGTFSIPDDYDIIYEPHAGFITPERAVKLYAQEAMKLGADIHEQEKVINWKRQGDDIQVQTNRAIYSCKTLVITAGPWAGELLQSVRDKLKVTRQTISWVNVNDHTKVQLGNFPCWMIDDHRVGGMYYGFPMLDENKFGMPNGLKVAYHYPGNPTHPDQVNRQIDQHEMEAVIKAINQYLPGVYQSINTLKTCLYTNTPDEHFIIDLLPAYNNQVVIAGGFSGHGFKFASAIGEIMADLAIKKKTDLPIAFLSSNRFA